MTYLAIRALTGLYLGGFVLLFLNAASRAVYARGRWTRKAARVAAVAAFALAWPLSMLSPAGRKALFHHLNQL